ncbi:MAG: hypothetical protein REU00_18215 [Pseudomonadota bacterium]|nr:hypothetical protein [Pseudomonadota bacterium]
MKAFTRLACALVLGAAAIGTLAAYGGPGFAVALQAGAWLCGGVR